MIETPFCITFPKAPGQTPYFTGAESNANERKTLCSLIREFKQIATAGSDTATGSKFPPK